MVVQRRFGAAHPQGGWQWRRREAAALVSSGGGTEAICGGLTQPATAACGKNHRGSISCNGLVAGHELGEGAAMRRSKPSGAVAKLPSPPFVASTRRPILLLPSSTSPAVPPLAPAPSTSPLPRSPHLCSPCVPPSSAAAAPPFGPPTPSPPFGPDHNPASPSQPSC